MDITEGCLLYWFPRTCVPCRAPSSSNNGSPKRQAKPPLVWQHQLTLQLGPEDAAETQAILVRAVGFYVGAEMSQCFPICEKKPPNQFHHQQKSATSFNKEISIIMFPFPHFPTSIVDLTETNLVVVSFAINLGSM